MIKEYKKKELIVIWNSSLCKHAAFCAKGLPSVFKPKEKPWIQLENDNSETIINQVNKCPTGAISIKE